MAANNAGRRDFSSAVVFGMSTAAFAASSGARSAFADVGIVEPFSGTAGWTEGAVAGGVSVSCGDDVGADGGASMPIAFGSSVFTAADVEIAVVTFVVPAETRTVDDTAESILAEAGFAAAGPAEIVIDA